LRLLAQTAAVDPWSTAGHDPSLEARAGQPLSRSRPARGRSGPWDPRRRELVERSVLDDVSDDQFNPPVERSPRGERRLVTWRPHEWARGRAGNDPAVRTRLASGSEPSWCDS